MGPQPRVEGHANTANGGHCSPMVVLMCGTFVQQYSIRRHSPNTVGGVLLYYIASYHFTSYCIMLYCLVLSCIVLSCIVLYCLVFYSIVLHCIVLYCIVLYCNFSL